MKKILCVGSVTADIMVGQHSNAWDLAGCRVHFHACGRLCGQCGH